MGDGFAAILGEYSFNYTYLFPGTFSIDVGVGAVSCASSITSQFVAVKPTGSTQVTIPTFPKLSAASFKTVSQPLALDRGSKSFITSGFSIPSNQSTSLAGYFGRSAAFVSWDNSVS